MSGSSPSGSLNLENAAFFSVLLPDLQSQLANQFQFSNLTTLQNFAEQFSSSTKYLQLSTAQIALSTDGGSYTLLIQGTGMSIPGATLLGLLNPGSISLSSVAGTITAAELYSGGTFSASSGAVSGGTVIASATFSATDMTVTSSTMEMVIDGANLPVAPATVGAIADGTYSGPAISVSTIEISNDGTQVGSLTFGANSLTLVSDDYKLVLSGTFPTSLSSSVIDSLVGTGNFSALNISLASAQLSRVSTRQVLLNVPNVTNQDFTGINLQDIPGTIASIAAAASVGDSVSFNSGTMQTPLDATLNGSTIEVAGTAGAAVLGFSGDSAITAANPSVDGRSTISSMIPGQNGAGTTVLDAAGVFVNQGSILADGPAGSTFTIDVEQNATNGVTTAGGFYNDGAIRVGSGNRMTIAIVAGAELFNAGTLLADGGSLFIDALPGAAGGGYAQQAGYAVIENGGMIETNATGTAGPGGTTETFLFADGVAGDTLKIDALAQFGSHILGFRAGDTIDLGGSLAIGKVVYNGTSGILDLDNSGGTILGTLAIEDLSLPSGTFSVNPTTGVAGSLIFAIGADGDTLLTTGASNTVIVTTGTLQTALDQTLNASTIDVAGTGSAAVLTLTGDNGVTHANPSVDGTSLIASLVPGQSAAGTTILTASGRFVNQGTILADGPAGSTFTLNVQQSDSGTAAVPGYFINYGTIQVDVGNRMTINIGGTSALFNAGWVIADGGSLFVNAATNAVDAGYAGIDSIAEIEGGGTIETNGTYPPTSSFFTPQYVFADGTAGDTLKIDNIREFDGNIRGFGVGDTIDLGAALSVGRIVFGSTIGPFGMLAMENSTGTVLASLLISGIYPYGTFAVTGGQADGFNFTTGADGDTLLTTAVSTDVWTDTSGALATAGDWSLNSPPGTLTAEIGLNSTSPFTVTTGTAAVATGPLLLGDPNALLQITSATSIIGGGISQLGGTLEVTDGNSLTALSLTQFSANSLLLLDPGSTLDVLGILNSTATNNGAIGVTSGGTIGVRIAGTLLINGGTLNAGPTQPVAGASGGSFYFGYGYPGAPASVTVENGGVVSDTFAVLGSDPTSFGVLTLTGAGTTWSDEIDPNDPLNSRGYITVGYNALAQNTPSDVAQPPYAGTAQVVVENGATLNDTRAYIGDSLDSAGSVTVTSGGQWNIDPITGGYLVLSAGGQATLAVTNGGTVNIGGISQFLSNGATVTASGGIFVGYSAGAAGTITVSDPNSLLNDDSDISLGLVSQGILNVLNGGAVSLYGAITAGLSAGASGTILVSGAGSTLYASNGVVIGDAGSGVLTVQDDGSLQTYGYLVVGGSTAGRIGTASGTVSLDDGGMLQTPVLDIWGGSTISVDATSGIDLGYDGIYTLGAVNIESFSTLAGDGLVAATVVNDGTIEATNNSNLSSSTGGNLEIQGAVTGTGSMIIAPGATLQIDGALGAEQTIVFSPGTPETLILSSTAGPISNPITGFAQGDRIEFANGVTVTVPTVTTLVNFNGSNGDAPYAGLIAATAGDLFGTTQRGGTYGFGTVFEIANTSTGYASTSNVLASFNNPTPDGLTPNGSLIADAAGDLFGTTALGGAYGDGAVFETRYLDGGYASTPIILASFNFTDGWNPIAGLIADAAGDLFGTTDAGGSNGEGTVFEIAKTGGSYASTPMTLVDFSGNNGNSPYAGLIADTAGDLFGTTVFGGLNDYGTVFEIAKTGGSYATAPTTLASFNYTNGADPYAGLIADAAGDLFGTTTEGGAYGDGTVFEIAKTGGSYASAPITLASFNDTDGADPNAGLIADAAGDLFGTTTEGGVYGDGTVFKIIEADGTYASTPTTLASFNYTDGQAPYGGLTADAVGDLFGTTLDGGENGDGTVFELTDSGFVSGMTAQGNTIIAAPLSGQTVSLDEVIDNPSIVPTGTIQSLLIDGPGTVSVSGTASINNLEISAGQLALSDATVNTDPVTVYANGDISGYGTVTGALTNLGTVTADGGTLELTGSVTGIGSLVVDPGATLLLDLGASSGAVTVNAGGLIAGGELDVGETGFGGLLIENQATVVTGTMTVDGARGLDISKTADGTGDAIVTGIGSLFDDTGTFVVGDGGLGNLSIESDGTVITTPGTVAGLAAAVIANQTGAGGSSVNVTGANSDWQITGALDVGNAATGLLAITNGATVIATTLDAGVAASGAGIVTISGPDADLSTTGTVSVGDAGSGELSILDGANVTIGGDLDVANTGTGTGNVDIEDTTGTITFGGNTWVGYNGVGVLTIGYNVTYIQDNGGINAGPNSTVTEDSFADPSPYLNNTSPNPFAINAQGVDQLAAYLFNTGDITIANNHTLTFETPIIYGDGGAFTLGSGDNLVLNADTVTGQTFTLGGDDKLTIGIDKLASIELPASGTGPFTPEANPNLGRLLIGDFDGVIAGFTSGDTIDVDTSLSSAAAGTLSQNGSVVSVIEIANGATLGVLRFDTAANAMAAVADDAIVLVPCFAAGTRIATARGEVAVEAIGVGDKVRVLLGGGADGCSEVVWVGRREVDCVGHATPRKVWPVRVAAGAFGPGRPYAELWLSPDHAVFVEGVLIPVRCLINGSTIVQVPVDRVTYHHVELAEHDVLLAEGLPAESFLDMRDGTNYANRPGPMRLYPDYSARMWEAFGCARLVVTGPELEAVRALVEGFARTQVAA